MTVRSAEKQSSNTQESFHKVDFLVMKGADGVQVWHEGTHYEGAGVADEVDVGDLFLALTPEITLRRVTPIDESKTANERGVEVETLAGPLLEAGETQTDETSVEALTGVVEGEAAATGPPVLLRESA